jgi:hypothetical protein
VKSLLQLDESHSLIAGLPHMRLDCLHELWVKGSDSFPDAKALDEILQQLESKSLLKRNRQRTQNQSKESLAKFHAGIAEVDWLLIDNNYDLSSKLWEVEQQQSTFKLVNLELKEEIAGFRNLGFANLEESGAEYQELFDHLLSLNPNLKIAFVQYPVNGFLKQKKSIQRIERSKLSRECTSEFQRVITIPLIDIDEENLSDKGPFYFSDHIYDVYATLITRLFGGEVCEVLAHKLPLIREVEQWVGITKKPAHSTSPKAGNPYDGLPSRNFWKPAVGERYPLAITELYDRKYPIETHHRIATFGSCFAQHIGHRLQSSGFNYLDLEPAPPGMAMQERAKHGYGIYSGRYGNVYTSLQMLQLFKQAFGEQSFPDIWESGGRYFDPFRPNIFPEGFASVEALRQERADHLAIVRRLFETVDVLIFTMGLTECWINQQTGAAYPTAPGVTVGSFDPDIHVFRNLGFAEIKQHMLELIERLRQVNPQARVLLTVSPVPLTATYEDRHVLVSTMHSKSVLRAVAGELAEEFDFVDYFPSYEIIVSSPYRSMFFKNNLRNIHDEGVDYVMTHFFRQHQIGSVKIKEDDASAPSDDFCDEVFLELSKKITSQ